MKSWFRKARFGVFVHWGHASTRGWELSWPLVGGLSALPSCQDVPAEELDPLATVLALKLR